MNTEWKHYDEHHYININNGMIVDKSTDLNNIQQHNIKGYEYL